MKIFDRYILSELAVPFFVTFVVLSFLLFVGRLIDLFELLSGGFSFMRLSSIIFCVILSFLGLTVPASYLVACSIVFSRLSSDMEIIALRSLGIPAKRVALSVLVFSFVVSLLLIFANFYISPLANKALKGMVVKIFLSKKDVGAKEKQFVEIVEGITIYTSKIENNWLYNLLLFDLRDPEKIYILEAKKGKFKRKDGDLVLFVENGKILVGGERTFQTLNFKEYSVSFATDIEEIFKKPLKRELTLPELLKRLARERARKRKHYLETLVHFHKRFALAFSPFIFALLSIPVSITFHRRERWASFLISIAIFLAYFGILSFSQHLINYNFPVFICAWLPNLVLFFVGIFIFLNKIEEFAI